MWEVDCLKILIIGFTGFAGTFIYNLLTGIEQVDLYGTFRYSTKNRNIIDGFKGITLLECEIGDVYSIEGVLSEVRPDLIFHLSVYNSFKKPLPTLQTNIIGTVNLIEAVKKIVPDAKILIPGFAEEYGIVQQEKMPIKESCLLNPVNPYGISKKFQEEIGFYYFKTMEFSAALGVSQVKEADWIFKKRQENVRYLNEKLKKFEEIFYLPVYDENVNYLAYPIIIKKESGIKRKWLRAKLEAEGIEDRPLPTQQPAFSYLKDIYKDRLPVANYIGKYAVYTDCHQYLEEEDLNYIIEVFERVFD